jgi:hypothetical protein
MAVLRFADKWDFRVQRILAVHQICNVGTSAEKVVAARMTGQPKLLVAGFNEICKQPLNRENGLVLGLNDLVLLCQLQYYRGTVIQNASRDTTNAHYPTWDQYLEAVVVGGVLPSESRRALQWYREHRPPAQPST